MKRLIKRVLGISLIFLVSLILCAKLGFAEDIQGQNTPVVIGYFDETGEVFIKEINKQNNKPAHKEIGHEIKNENNKNEEKLFKGMIRKQLRTLANGDVEIQDFYYPSLQKQTDSFVVVKDSDLTSGYLMPKDGQITLYYENGSPKTRLSFKAGEQTGLYQEWYDTGCLKIEAYSKETGLVFYNEWDENGKLIVAQDADLASENIIGYFDEKWENFSRAPISGKGFMRKRLQVLDNGAVEFQDFYYPSMKKQIDPAIANPDMKLTASDLMPKNGLVTGYYEDGNIEWTHFFKEGALHGVSKSYYPNARLGSIQTYIDGIKQGVFVWYYDNGQKKIEVLYENNTRITSQEWDERGNLLPTSSEDALSDKKVLSVPFIGNSQGKNWEKFSGSLPSEYVIPERHQ